MVLKLLRATVLTVAASLATLAFASGAAAQEPASSTDLASTSVPAAAPAEPEYQKPTISLLVARPLDAYDAATVWASGLAQEFLSFRMGSLEQIAVIGSDTVTALVADNGTLSRSAQRQPYLTAAKQLGATHVLFPALKIGKDGKSVQVSAALFSVSEARSTASAEASATLENIGDALDTCVARLIPQMGLAPSKAAARFLKSTIVGSPKSVRAIGDAIAAARESGQDAQKWAEEFKSIFGREPQALLAGWLCAAGYGRAGQPAAAAAAVEALVYKLGPYYAALYPQAARYYRLADKLDEGLRMVTVAEKMGLRTAQLLSEKAMLLEATENWEQADAAFQEVLRIDGTNPHATVYLIKRYNAAQKAADALELATRFTQANADDVTVQIEMGKSLLSLERLDEALTALRKAVELDPANAAALMLLGDLYMRKMECGPAIECYLKVAEKGSRTADPYVKAARCYNVQGGPAQALELLRKVENEFYGNPGIQREIGIAAFATNDMAAAKRSLNRYAQTGEPDTAVLVRLAQVYRQEGDTKNALKTLERAQAIAPEDAGIKAQIEALSARKSRAGVDSILAASEKPKRGPAVKLSLGIGAGLVCVAALASAIYFDGKVKDAAASYAGARNAADVNTFRTRVEQNQRYRNILYALSGVCGAGCTVSFVIPGKK